MSRKQRDNISSQILNEVNSSSWETVTSRVPQS